MEFLASRQRRPIACNLWSLEQRAQAYISCLSALPIPAMEQLEGGLRNPFLLDFGLTADQRISLWQAVWDSRTLVRTAIPASVSGEDLLHTI